MINEEFIVGFLKRIKRNETAGSLFFGVLVLFLVSIVFFRQYHQFLISRSTPLYQNVDEVQASPATQLVYVTQKGDSTWKVAEKFYGDGKLYTLIEQANSLKPNQDITEGMNLVIPENEKLKNIEPNTHTTATPSAKPSMQSAKTHTTTSSDTLWKLAIQYYNDGNKWTKIYEANKSKIPNPNTLEKGIELAIPE